MAQQAQDVRDPVGGRLSSRRRIERCRNFRACVHFPNCFGGCLGEQHERRAPQQRKRDPKTSRHATCYPSRLPECAVPPTPHGDGFEVTDLERQAHGEGENAMITNSDRLAH